MISDVLNRLALALLLAAPVAGAEVIVNPAPPMPDSESGLEPEITIAEDGKTKIEEYRAGGQVYMIKITPWKGVPYFLVDSDGDGTLEQRSNDREPRLLIPSWVLLRWR